MFYPVESLKRGGRFYLCWVADSWPLRFATITHKQLWSQDIRKICDDLRTVMINESGRQKNRFSLRLSSQLLRGLVRLYQRKVTVFVGDLCMINAHVMKLTHKKWSPERTATEIAESRPLLPMILLEEQEIEERVAERIQNSGNIVANVEDITLKESAIPEKQVLDDGFGELCERSVEAMLGAGGGGGGAEGAGVSLLADTTRGDSSAHLPPPRAHMEPAGEHDTTLFAKSIGDVPLPDFEKEIPEIPEILPPELPAPPVPVNNETIEKITEEPISETKEKPADNAIEEIVLEELREEPQVKRRRKNKLIIDKSIKFSSQYMASRLENINVELRCESSAEDVIGLLVPARVLLSRAAHAGWRARSNLGDACARLLYRHLSAPHRPVPRDKSLEEALMALPRRSTMQHRLEAIEEEPTEKIPEMQVDLQNITVAAPEIAMEIADLPTQKLEPSPAQKRASELEVSSKRFRRGGAVSFRQSQYIEEVLPIDANKENIPVSVNVPVEENMTMQELVTTAKDRQRLTAMLEVAGLADAKETAQEYRHEKELTQVRNAKKSSDGSETPLGSLDRTKVSLGDSEATTDSKRFLREEWGTQGTMHKIYQCVRRGAQPLSVARLVCAGPALPGQRRLAAARCFTSILNLKEHGFINVLKDPETYEILNITLGRKLLNK